MAWATLNEKTILSMADLYLDDKQKSGESTLIIKIEELNKKFNGFGSQNKIVLGKIQHIS